MEGGRVNTLSETYLTVAQIAAHVGRTTAIIYRDETRGLITLKTRPGIKGQYATAHEVNKYIRLKFFGKVPLLTEDNLNQISNPN